MNTLKYALATLVLMFSISSLAKVTPLVLMTDEDDGGVDSGSSSSSGGYDRWNCNEQDGLIGVGLQCVSCGVQQYYSDRGQQVVPSEKWIALLASSARAFRDLQNNGGRRDRGNGYSSPEMDAMKRVVISQIQAYGFCTKYISKDAMRATGGKRYRDLSGSEWKYVSNYISHDHQESDTNDIGKFFGFRQPTLLSHDIGGNVAMNNMRDLLDDSAMNDSSIVSKRSVFMDKLKRALTDYDVSGEKVDKKEMFAGDDKDNGIRRCMQEVQQRLKSSQEYADANVEMCGAMAKACQLESSFCSNDQNSGQTRPQPTSYRPASGNSLPAPPRPGSRSNGAIQ